MTRSLARSSKPNCQFWDALSNGSSYRFPSFFSSYSSIIPETFQGVGNPRFVIPCAESERLTDDMYYCFVSDHETMVGMRKIEAGDDLLPAKVRKTKKGPVKQEYEEWGGIDQSEE